MDAPQPQPDRVSVLRRLSDRVKALGGRPAADDAPSGASAESRAAHPPAVEVPPRAARPARSRHAPADSRPTARLDELRAEERYQRERLALYRRKRLLGRPTTDSHLRELERLLASARDRVRSAVDRRDDGRGR
jgi:hypothetical protein